MSEIDERQTPRRPAIDTFGDQLLDAAGERSQRTRRWRRRIAVPLAVLAVATPVAFAVENPFSTRPPETDSSGPAVTVGFIDPTTNEPIRCPDGELFTRTFDPQAKAKAEPTCSDGSVPPIYRNYEQREQEALERIREGELLKGGVPRLDTFEVQPKE